MNGKRNVMFNIFYIVIGIALIACKAFGIIDDTYTGFAGGLLTVGVIQLARNVKYINNSEYKEKVDIEINDERNRYLRMQAWSWAGYMMVIILGIATIICMVVGKRDLMLVCSYSICLMLVLFWGSYLYLNHRGQ